MGAVEQCVEALRSLILAGEYLPGEKLAETELAARLGVSRTPVRDALRRLSAEGLVEISSNKGARIVTWSPQELDHVFALRGRLEGYAAGQAAKCASEGEIDRLDELARAIERHAKVSREEYLEHVYELNSKFHGLLLNIVGSTTLITAVSGLVHAPILARTLHAYDEAEMWRSINHHIEIVAALRARDSDWAESVMRSHLLSARACATAPTELRSVETEGA